MAKLIEGKQFVKDLCKLINAPKQIQWEIEALLEATPTAYDVNKVCERIFEEGFSDKNYDEYIITTNTAIEIVKGGGVNG